MTVHSPMEVKLDPDDSTPRYLQISNVLSEAVKSGYYKVNQALPAERQLAEAFGVSRVTARKALEHLALHGLIYKVRGSGNYITPIEMPLSRLSGFSEDLNRRGFHPTSRWLTRALAEARPDEQLALGLASGQRVARLDRLRMHDDVIVSYEMSVVPEHYIPEPMEVDASMYDYLARRGDMPVRALQRFKACNASADVADKLALPLGEAVFYLTRVGYAASGAAVELTTSYCVSEYFDFVAEMTRPSEANFPARIHQP